MFIERVVSEGLAHFSYLVGSGGEAVVIDPRRDGEVYRELAEARQVRITHIFETHRNEDYVIGSLDLAARTGAEIHHGEALPFKYGSAVSEGEHFRLGGARLSVLATPGHTDESLSLVLADTKYGEDPVAVFSGDALFVGDVGRTDFFPDRAEEVAGLLHHSLFHKLLPLGDHVLLYPGHGAGSVCGAGMAARDFSSLGYERRHNPALQHTDRADFILQKVAERHYLPPYFRMMERYNLEGAPPLAEAARPRAERVGEFAAAREERVVIDVRGPEAFGGAHLPGSQALPLGLVPSFAGWLLPYDRPLAVVADSPEQVATATRQLARIGYDRVEAYLAGGLHEWEVSGREFRSVPQVSPAEAWRRLEGEEALVLLDVRSEREFRAGHLPGARHIYVGELPERMGELAPDQPVLTFCGSGRRAIIAASLLERAGFAEVGNCLGGLEACQAAGCPVVTED